jgi:hypothetical protein
MSFAANLVVVRAQNSPFSDPRVLKIINNPADNLGGQAGHNKGAKCKVE